MRSYVPTPTPRSVMVLPSLLLLALSGSVGLLADAFRPAATPTSAWGVSLTGGTADLTTTTLSRRPGGTTADGTCTATTLFNVPPGSEEEGGPAASSTTSTSAVRGTTADEEDDEGREKSREREKDAADRQAPPQSFYELQINSVKAAERAVADGHRLLEIEFPPLPANVLEMDDVSAYEISAANLRLATDFAKSFAQNGKKVAIMLPDEAELDIAREKLGGTVNPHPGVTVSSLRKSDEDDTRVIKPEQLLISLFGNGSGGSVRPINGTDMYVVIVASAQELPDVEELQNSIPDEDDAVIVLYNLKLDTLRGDLGAPAFPRKEFHDRFLSKVKPTYYLRTRQYSRSTSRPPFMVNYQGCMFRSYPGQYQTLLDTGDGRAYRRVGGSDVRPALGEFKEQLTRSLKTEGVLDEEGKTLSFLRTGYKTTTWWEEEREDASDAWMT